MAQGTAQPGAELLAFERFREASAQPLAYGYGHGPRGLRELRAREFGRLAGEAAGHLRGAGGRRAGVGDTGLLRSSLLPVAARYRLRGAF